VDRLERLVNLVAALIDTSHPMTRAEIRQCIDGYSDDDDAFRRNFERDKELLRQMGFPVVTVAVDPAHPDDVGYRIPRELYELPDPGLDDSELAALRLAAGAVQIEGEWGKEAVIRALRKLGGGVDDSATPSDRSGGLAELPAEDDTAVVFAAVADRTPIEFTYRGETRVVEPWRLSFHRGHWYLAGMDRHREGERLFRLDRVTGGITVAGPPGSFERPTASQAAPPEPWRLGEEDEILARLLVDGDHAHWARQDLGEGAVIATHPDGAVEFGVRVTNRAAFISFALGYLDHAEILGPPDLRQQVIDWMRTAMEGAHE
jgi:proteasome accessory factor B